MKPVYVIILVLVVAAAAFFGYKVYHRSQLQESNGASAGSGQSIRIGNGEGEIPQSGDLCGGTGGGNGQILNVGNNSITIKLNRDGRLLKKGSSKIINLTGQTTIKTFSGTDSVSDLKTGDNVTIAGKPNPDGSLTAKIIVVCNGK